MSMDAMQTWTVLLLKAAVTGQGQVLPEGISLEALLPLAKQQGLATLIYEGAILSGIPASQPAMEQLFRQYYTILLQSERQMAQVRRLLDRFQQEGIDHLPLKGCILKELYPRQELRPMGDADILIRWEQYPRIRGLMEDLGFALVMESNCEQTWKHPDLLVELHRRLVQPSNRDLTGYFGDGWQRACREEGHRWGYSAEDAFLYLFTHFAKHYRGGGIGCRHVLDLWVFLEKHPQMDQDYVLRELETLGLAIFYRHILSLLDGWFGAGELGEVEAFISQRIFTGGSFGSYQDRRIFAELSMQDSPSQDRRTRLHYLRRTFFPSLWAMKEKYPLLRRLPILLPLCWVWRWGEVLVLRRRYIGRAIRTTFLLSDERMAAHRKNLEYVGLRYDPQEE